MMKLHITNRFRWNHSKRRQRRWLKSQELYQITPSDSFFGRQRWKDFSYGFLLSVIIAGTIFLVIAGLIGWF